MLRDYGISWVSFLILLHDTKQHHKTALNRTQNYQTKVNATEVKHESSQRTESDRQGDRFR